PSALGLNHLLYDDFPWIHSRVEEYVHNAAPFLAWHSYFLHIYEATLKEECSFAGSIPCLLPTQSLFSFFSTRTNGDRKRGFGSDGDSSISRRPILDGYCVRDGPLQNFEISYLDKRYYPHRLSRGFLAGEDLRNQSESLSPERMEELLRLDHYDSFNLGLENGPHLAIPRSVRGDFSLLTAPSDPVFFLHHGQLDRVWWRWQAERSTRRMEYAGISSHGSERLARISDELDMGGLAPGIAVSEVLDSIWIAMLHLLKHCHLS
ncbi:Di-copper centre-containing protein, partial [Lentithecium fluviatile CBS 122367]